MLPLETFSKWDKIDTNGFLCKIRDVHKRASQFDFFKAMKTLIFFTATFGNLNNFVLWSYSKSLENFITCSLWQIRMTQEVAQVFERYKLPKITIFYTAYFRKFNKFVFQSFSKCYENSTTWSLCIIRNVCKRN